VPGVIEQIIDTFVRYRESEEVFVDTFSVLGLEPFKEAVYPSAGGVGMNNLLRLQEGVARLIEDDPWTLVRDLQVPLPAGKLILPLARWLKTRGNTRCGWGRTMTWSTSSRGCPSCR
jgi:hypothetical protein